MSKPIKKVLIANRGEIAIRIIRACQDIGIETVAIYSKADEHSIHVKLADEAVCVGPADSKSSYLHIPSVIAAAEVTNADAIHPGYGFLAENAEFARVCSACNITFIGPTADSIALLGDKVQARATAVKANIPLLPGTINPVESIQEAESEAEKIGYPVILKAAHGGGGRGIYIIRSNTDLHRSYDKARSEAKAAFGSDEMYVEKFCEHPRHVEIQVAADHHGNAIYLGERDCSIQRRHQKLVEEAPCPVITEETRRAMGEAAVRLVQEVGYHNIGTVEYLLDSDLESFYFMEMNTRIQVEHPVTELVTGIDLVKLQLAIATGEKLPLTQKDVKLTGHAVECRINAEDPETFAPCPGKIDELHVPGGVGVRFDSFVYHGYSVPPYYDSMLGKLITYESNRELALRKMERCLKELQINGIKTNKKFFSRLLADEKFQNNQYDTNFLQAFLTRSG